MKKVMKAFKIGMVNQPWIVFLVLALAITFPMWNHGYLFLLDWGITATDDLESLKIWQQSFVMVGVTILGRILHFGFYQKSIFFTEFFLLGYGGYLFVQEVLQGLKLQGDNIAKQWVMYIGGIFITVNPFIYGRSLDGQWTVIASVVGVLYLIIYLLRWKRTHRSRELVVAIVYATLTVLFSQHAIFFVLVISLIFFILIWEENKDYTIMKWWFVIVGCILVANVNVVWWYVSNMSNSSNVVTQFDERHLHVFRTIKNGYASIYLNVLSLHGYWGEGQNRFLSTQNYVYIWKPIFFIFSSVAIVGVWIGRKKFVIKFLLIGGVIAYVLAMGTQGVFAVVSRFLYEYVPFYIGLRESHKWTGILLIYGVGLMTYGLFYIIRQQKKIQIHISGVFFVMLIFMYTPNMLWGFSGQITPRDFPEEWYNIRSEFGCNKITGNILFLPWHQYMKFDFLGDKNVINPAQKFFGSCVLQGDNMEAGDIYTQKSGELSELLLKYINKEYQYETFNVIQNSFVDDMNRVSVRYIIISKSEDYKQYAWLENIDKINKVKEGAYLIVYKLQ